MGGHLTPKHHLFVHLTQRIPWQGNPRFYSTFLDETLNAVVSYVANASMFAVEQWEERVMERIRLQGVLQPLAVGGSWF